MVNMKVTTECSAMPSYTCGSGASLHILVGVGQAFIHETGLHIHVGVGHAFISMWVWGRPSYTCGGGANLHIHVGAGQAL